MEKERITNHIKISVVCLVVSYLLSSYAFGSFDPNAGKYDDRLMAVIVTVIGTIVANFLYHESYSKEENKSN